MFQSKLFLVLLGFLFSLGALSGVTVTTSYSSPKVQAMDYSSFSLAPYVHKISGYSIFEGDSHGDFKGDIVAILEDGSMWKVHPHHREKYLAWQAGHEVHVGRRESHYYFKREHKFTLVNHTACEEVYVMLVKSPSKIVSSGQSVPSLKKQTINSAGIVQEEFVNYKKNITLNDGIFWEIESAAKDKEYKVGSEVYVGYNNFHESENVVRFFVIYGHEREATFREARPGNYFYHW